MYIIDMFLLIMFILQYIKVVHACLHNIYIYIYDVCVICFCACTHIYTERSVVQNSTDPVVKHPAGLEMGRVKTAFSCDWQEVNHAFRSVFSCFYVVHEGQFYCDSEFSLGFTVYS